MNKKTLVKKIKKIAKDPTVHVYVFGYLLGLMVGIGSMVYLQKQEMKQIEAAGKLLLIPNDALTDMRNASECKIYETSDGRFNIETFNYTEV